MRAAAVGRRGKMTLYCYVCLGQKRAGELMTRMGRSSTRAALIYQHATQDRDQAIAQALGKALKGARKEHGKKTTGTEDQEEVVQITKARSPHGADLAFRLWSGRRESNPRS
ncbi:hypothetical protein [Nonomuraea sp. NPDC003709]|uniref:hypothetical protein n=1 Tax=Nonomuraea sp. NPDC003709 TaxID=3154450 RepID=UPI0033B7E1F1